VDCVVQLIIIYFQKLIKLKCSLANFVKEKKIILYDLCHRFEVIFRKHGFLNTRSWMSYKLLIVTSFRFILQNYTKII